MNDALKSKKFGSTSNFGSCNPMWKLNPTKDPDFDVLEYLSARANNVAFQALRDRARAGNVPVSQQRPNSQLPIMRHSPVRSMVRLDPALYRLRVTRPGDHAGRLVSLPTIMNDKETHEDGIIRE